jgi:hypothetical protein
MHWHQLATRLSHNTGRPPQPLVPALGRPTPMGDHKHLCQALNSCLSVMS